MALAKNVGSTDKIIRLVVGALLVAFGFLSAGLASTLGIVAVVAGLVLVATGLINFCPIFKILGISSFRS